jgi:hypothetical protein
MIQRHKKRDIMNICNKINFFQYRKIHTLFQNNYEIVTKYQTSSKKSLFTLVEGISDRFLHSPCWTLMRMKRHIIIAIRHFCQNGDDQRENYVQLAQLPECQYWFVLLLWQWVGLEGKGNLCPRYQFQLPQEVLESSMLPEMLVPLLICCAQPIRRLLSSSSKIQRI